MKINIPQEKISSLIWIILAILLFISSFFLIYSNEVILEKYDTKTKLSKNVYYSKFYFSKELKKTADYKNSVVTNSEESWLMVKWLLRVIWFLWVWFAFSLISFQIFKETEKDYLVKKSFIFAIIWWIIFIILLKIYIFYINWWFNINLSWMSAKWQNWLSFLDKFYIISIIIIIFIFLWMLYNKIQNKSEE